MDKFLWLVLTFRILQKSLPYILGLLGASLIIGYIHPSALPGGIVVPLFLAIACGLSWGIKSSLSGHRDNPGRNSGLYRQQRTRRRWPDERM